MVSVSTCRHYSSIKDDEIVKSWLNEIKTDFEKEKKVRDKCSHALNSAENIKGKEIAEESVTATDYTDQYDYVENVIEKLEKLGFTVEEMIDLVKNAKKLDGNLIKDEDKSPDSDTENKVSGETSDSLNTGADIANSKKMGSGQTGENEGSTNKMKEEEWAVVKTKPAEKTDWSVVEVEDFVKFAEAEPDFEDTWVPPIELKRGMTGVYDIEDLVKVLRAVNAQDVITIRIPQELDFADYIVIASAKSQRHMQAISSDVKWIYKQKKDKSDRYFTVEGETEKSDWYAMDLGNIILHIFMPETRDVYDLETLWTVGAKFDPKCAEEEKDPYVYSVDDLPWLKELEQVSSDPDQSTGQASENREKHGNKMD